MAEIAITFLIIAALIVYVPRVFFLALGLAAAVAALFVIWLAWGPMGDVTAGDCAKHWRVGCRPAMTPAMPATPSKPWWETHPDRPPER